jgi:hypothetical protein
MQRDTQSEREYLPERVAGCSYLHPSEVVSGRRNDADRVGGGCGCGEVEGGGTHPRQERPAAGQKDGVGEGKDWNGGTHGLGCKIGKLLEQFVFWG